ncbi:hypothetical protein J6590_091702 [Homalodisca vitripennis]|nr:hypothetical protein J6590_091702 [Homalodisca vitripennis]
MTHIRYKAAQFTTAMKGDLSQMLFIDSANPSKALGILQRRELMDFTGTLFTSTPLLEE